MDLARQYAKNIVRVLVYIESHLDEELELNSLAKIAHYSPFHFHRLFQFFVGESLHKYIRRLRIEKAAMQLCAGDRSITDIAMEAQYETPSAFTRAFKQCVGRSPQKYRSHFQREIEKMQQKIEKLAAIAPSKIAEIDSLPVLFVRRCGPYASSGHDAWTTLHAFIAREKLDKLRYFGISHDSPQLTAQEQLRYDACIFSTGEIAPKDEVGVQRIAGGRYALFTYKGPYDGISEIFDRIFLKWLPTSKEKFDESRPTFAEYFKIEMVKIDPNQLVTDIYIPLLG